MSRTLVIIKPDAFRKDLVDNIMERINSAGFTIVRDIETVLTKPTVSSFYIHHKGAKFFDDLVDFMSNKKVRLLVLEKINAVEHWRDILDVIRSDYEGSIKHENLVHGSDSDSAARREIESFFGQGAYLI